MMHFLLLFAGILCLFGAISTLTKANQQTAAIAFFWLNVSLLIMSPAQWIYYVLGITISITWFNQIK